MKIESIIRIVNTLCINHSYSKVRPLILNEWSRLTESKNFQSLNSSAQQFLKILQDEQKFGDLESLTNLDKKTLNLINTSINKSDFNYARQIFAQHQSLLETDIAQRWLTSDARIIYDAWKKSF